MSSTRATSLSALPDDARAAVLYLRSPEAIRARTGRVLEAGLAAGLAHFSVHLDRLDQAASYVLEVTREAYPDLAIPYHSRWGHFRVGGLDRVTVLERDLTGRSADERGRALYDLAVTSVLLDAGAGPDWRYVEPGTARTWTRSEGLAVASFDAFVAGAFSSDPLEAPLRADADGLARVDAARLGACFQAGPGNPLVGLEGRAALMARLGAAVRAAPHIFLADEAGGPPRIGGMFSYLRGRAAQGVLPAREILAAVLEGLGPIWESPTRIAGVRLGDVWPHPAARAPAGAGEPALAADLVPFHKLSQWLSYSLVEPLEAAGIQVVDLDALTGLAEYRNGGLFVDLGVIEPRHPDVTGQAHGPGSEIIVEWRALTLALLDRLAERVRAMVGLDPQQLPLTRILEGGTWRAGRKIAAERRPDGGPPIRIDSDGTVF